MALDDRWLNAGRAAHARIAGTPSPVITAFLLTAIFGWYYAYLLAGGSFNLLREDILGLTFNSMLEHLLHGQFDVDPEAIKDEAFVLNGKTYRYFGIFPALLRIGALPLVDLKTTFLGRISCVLAVCVLVFFELLAILTINRATRPAATRWMLAALILAVLLSGPQIQLLQPMVYTEPVLWAGALAAAFIYCAIRGIFVHGRFTTATLTAMAIPAGLCLLTRVSTALGLYVALGLVMARLLVIAIRDESTIIAVPGGAQRRTVALLTACGRAFGARWVLLPSAILIGFAVICGIVNYGRWGNPFAFVDLTAQLLMTERFPDRIPRVETYGEFNIGRTWFGLIYYLFPIWIITNDNGQFIFNDFMVRMLDAAEAPASSFFVSDPLLVGLAVYGIVRIYRDWRHPTPDLKSAALLLTGLAVPACLMLMAIYMAFRYRIEFYPALTLAALIGFQTLCLRMQDIRPSRARLVTIAVTTAALIGVACSHLLLIMYLHAPLGRAEPSTVLGDPMRFFRHHLDLS